MKTAKRTKLHPKPTTPPAGTAGESAAGFPIVGLGASAGGLEALEQFFRSVPPDSGLAFVVVQHLDPTHKGILPELLQRGTGLKAVQVRDRTQVRPDCIYVIPPNKDMSLLHGVLHLLVPTAPRGLRLPIDFFFRSLALDQHERGVGVILSGMGADGTLGLRAIKEQAGVALVQAPATAKFDGMPRSAIDAGLADIVAPADELPGKLVAYLRQKPLLVPPEAAVGDKALAALEKIVILLRAHTGHDFSAYKRNTLFRRIERRMGIHQLGDLAGYVRYLGENSQELDLLFRELLIGVTNFFRDPATWEQLRTETLPALLATRTPGHALRAWVAGCSTGEEAYSLAMVFREAVALTQPSGNFALQIFATDLDRDAIDQARQGLFPDNLAADVSPARLKRFFVREEHGYRVRKEIREMVLFAPQNLVMDPPFTKLDFLSCRNLLIYLTAEVQQKLMPLFHYSLVPGGVLLLGSAETAGNGSALFAPARGKFRIFRRLEPAGMPTPVDFPARFGSPRGPGAEVRPAALPAASLQAQADQLVLQRFAPPAVLVDDQGAILEANLMGATLLGLGRSRLLRRNLLPFIAPASRAAVRDFLKQVFAAPGRQFCEVALAKTAGPVQWAGLHGSLESVPAGSPKRCWLAISDLTGLRRADAELRTSETRYRRLFEAAHDGVLLLDPATRQITDANPFMTKLLGYPHAELIGKELFEIGLLQDERASQVMFRKLQRRHAVRYEDLPLANRSGRHQEVEVVANLYQEGGRPVIQCNIRDITQRKHTEEVLRRNEALLSALVGQAPVGVYVVNARFQVVQANPLACAAFRNVHPLLGRDFAEVLQAVWPPRVAGQLASRFRQTLRTGEPFQSAAFRSQRQDTGARECYEWQIQRVTLPDGEPGVVCFFNDVTERNRLEAAGRRVAVLAASNTRLAAEVVRRKAVERSLTHSRQEQVRLLAEARELQAQLRHLSRSVLRVQEEERRLISRELHDVVAQTLTGISLRLGGLAAQAALGPAALRRSLAATQELLARSVETVHQFARELRPSVLDDLGLVPALHTYMEGLAARTGLRIRLIAGKEADQLDAARRTVLFRVAQEALTNVARHAAAEHVEVVLQAEPGGYCLKVKDDGRSFRVDRALHATRGERLGLLGMRERLEMVGGRLELTSAPGVGTTVTAHVPLVAPKLKSKS